MTRRSATSATTLIIVPRMKRSSRRGIRIGPSVAEALSVQTSGGGLGEPEFPQHCNAPGSLVLQRLEYVQA